MYTAMMLGIRVAQAEERQRKAHTLQSYLLHCAVAASATSTYQTANLPCLNWQSSLPHIAVHSGVATENAD